MIDQKGFKVMFAKLGKSESVHSISRLQMTFSFLEVPGGTHNIPICQTKRAKQGEVRTIVQGLQAVLMKLSQTST